MAQNLTQPTDSDVAAFIAAVPHPVRQRDARTLLELMGRATGQPARMWGTTIVGFGTYHYKYASGREGDMAAASFSPRAAATTVYFNDGFDDHADGLARLGPHTLSKSCLYLKDLDGVDLDVLEDMVRASYRTLTTAGFGKRLSGPSAGTR